MVGQSLYGVAAGGGDDEKVDGRGIELGEEDTHNDGGDDESDDDDLVGGGGDGQDMQSLGPNWFSQCSSRLTAPSFLAQLFVSHHQPSVVTHFFLPI